MLDLAGASIKIILFHIMLFCRMCLVTSLHLYKNLIMSQHNLPFLTSFLQFFDLILQNFDFLQTLS